MVCVLLIIITYLLSKLGLPINDELNDRINSLSFTYNHILELLYVRKTRLQDSRQLLQFYQNVDDELDWMKEKEQSLSLSDLSKATDYTMVFHKLHSHQALEAEVHNHEATLRNIIDNGNELSSKKDYAADTILSKIDELENTWDDLYDVIAKRKDRIEEMMSMQQFLSEADYLEGQISLLTGLLSHDQNRIDEESIDSILKNHANLELEVENCKEQLQLLNDLSCDLNPNDQLFETAIERKAVITQKYEVLVTEVSNRHDRLLALQALFRYLNEIEIVSSWIGDKEAVLASFEAPTELIEAEMILQRFKGFERDIIAYQDRFDNVINTGNELINRNTDGTDEIVNAQTKLKDQWMRLLMLNDQKKDQLAMLLILLQLLYEIDEVKNWIADKGTGLNDFSYTIDPAAVLQMQRQLNAIERETPAIEERIADLESKRDDLAEEQPDQLENVNEKLDDLYQVWDDIQNLAQNQLSTVGKCSNVQRLTFDMEDLQEWLKIHLAKLNLGNEVLNTLPEVEKQLNDHNELLDEYANRKLIFDRINEIAPMHFTDDTVGKRLKQRLEEINCDWNELGSLCNKRKAFLVQNQQYLIFQRDCKYIEGLLHKQDQFLAEAMNELGIAGNTQQENIDDQCVETSKENLSSLPDLLDLAARQKDYSRGLENGIQRVAQVSQLVKFVLADDHYAKAKLTERTTVLSDRVEQNRQLFAEVAIRLDKTIQLQNFYQRCNELIDWINEKLSIASGDSNVDPAYVSRLLQKHRTFETELVATKAELNAITELGEHIIQDQPESQVPVDNHLTDVHNRWRMLMDACSTRSKLLNDRYNEIQFIRIIDDLQDWMSSAELTLANTDSGKDLASCNTSMAKLTVLF